MFIVMYYTVVFIIFSLNGMPLRNHLNLELSSLYLFILVKFEELLKIN